MKPIQILRIAKKILVSRKYRFLFTLLLFSVGVSVLLFIFTFSQGIHNTFIPPLLKKASPTTLVVQSDFRRMALFPNQSKIHQKDVTEIEKLPHVKDVNRQIILSFPNSLEASLLGFTFQTDIPIFGVEKLPPASEKNKVIPIVISPHLLDIFNSSFIDILPGGFTLSTNDVLGKEINIFFGKSSFFDFQFQEKESVSRTGYISHFSSNVPAIGISIPLATALQISKEFGIPAEKIIYQQVFVEVDTLSHVSEVQKNIQEKGFLVKNQKELGGEIKNSILLVRTILSVSGFIIFLITLSSLSSLISLLTLEQQKNIGILRVIGATKKDIFLLFLAITFFISFLGTLLGIGISLLGTSLVNKKILLHFSHLSFFPETFFPFNLQHIFILFIGAFFCAFLFSLPPIIHTLKKEPLKALWG